MIGHVDFAITDVETTGLFPERGDRIIEIAVIRVESTGKVLDEYATLVNPQRDIGQTSRHGLTTKDVCRAPVFEEVAGDVLSLLAGAVFVAHNVHFDMRFVRSEMDRIGCVLPRCPFLCTMRLARRADRDFPSRRLDEMCKYFGIRLREAHSAYGDARATAELFAVCLAKMRAGPDLPLHAIGVTGELIAKEFWPTLPLSRITYRRDDAAQDRAREPSYIGRLVARLPGTGCATPEIEEYRSLLDRALEDRRVTEEEAGALFSLCQELGITREQAVRAHRAHMRDLLRAALEDGVITESERRDLDEVRQLLSISTADYESLLAEINKEEPVGGAENAASSRYQSEIPGRTVCFTGELNCQIHGEPATRALAEGAARHAGMIVQPRVTKTLDYLVAADPDSISRKAEQARKYGVWVLAEPVFWRMVGIDIE